jgi:hypothetical protein
MDILFSSNLAFNTSSTLRFQRHGKRIFSSIQHFPKLTLSALWQREILIAVIGS